MINGSDSVLSILKKSFSSVDGLVMHISSLLYFLTGAWLFLVGVGKPVLSLICFFMVFLIFLLYVSLLVFSSDGREARYANAVVICVVDYLFFDKFMSGVLMKESF